MAVTKSKSLTSVNYVDGSLELSKSDFEQLNGMIRGISLKYKGWYGCTFDDIYELCWEKALTIIHNGGYDFDLICQCCYNGVSDLMKSLRRRQDKQFSCDTDIMDTALYGGSSESEYHEDEPVSLGVLRWNPDFNSTYEIGKVNQGNVDFRELLNLFEKGSKEWKWLYLVAIRMGCIEVSTEVYDRLFTNKHSIDFEVSALLGYKHQSYTGYRRIKKRVQETVSRYLGL